MNEHLHHDWHGSEPERERRLVWQAPETTDTYSAEGYDDEEEKKPTPGPTPTVRGNSRRGAGRGGLEPKMEFNTTPYESDRLYEKDGNGEYKVDEKTGRRLIVENKNKAERLSLTSTEFAGRLDDMFNRHYQSNRNEYFYKVLPKHINAARTGFEREELQSEFESAHKSLPEVIENYAGLLTKITNEIFSAKEFQRGVANYFKAYENAWKAYRGSVNFVDRVAQKIMERSGFWKGGGQAPGVYKDGQLIGLSSIVEPKLGFSMKKRSEVGRQRMGFLPTGERDRQFYAKEIARAEKAYGSTWRTNWERKHGEELAGLSGEARTDALNGLNRQGLDYGSYSYARLRETGLTNEQIAIGQGKPIERLEWPPDEENRASILVVDQEYRGAVMDRMNEELKLGFTDQEDFASNDIITFEEKQPATQRGFSQVLQYTRYDRWLDGKIVNPHEGFVVTFQREARPGLSPAQQEQERREDVHIVDKAKADEMLLNLRENPWYQAIRKVGGFFNDNMINIIEGAHPDEKERDYTLYSSADFIELFEKRYPDIKKIIDKIWEAGAWGDRTIVALKDFGADSDVPGFWGKPFDYPDNPRHAFLEQLVSQNVVQSHTYKPQDESAKKILDKYCGGDWEQQVAKAERRYKAIKTLVELGDCGSGTTVQEHLEQLGTYNDASFPDEFRKKVFPLLFGPYGKEAVECLQYHCGDAQPALDALDTKILNDPYTRIQEAMGARPPELKDWLENLKELTADGNEYWTDAKKAVLKEFLKDNDAETDDDWQLVLKAWCIKEDGNSSYSALETLMGW